MNFSQLLPMAAFALAASISPGPMNLVCLSCGTRYGVKTGLWFVTGATVGFTVLFIAVGLGLYSFLSLLPGFSLALHWSGIAFLLYLCFGLIKDDGRPSSSERSAAPGFMTGATMQWLNPKAWMASASGIGVFAGGGDLQLTMMFAAIYFPICWLSLSSWVVAGRGLSRYVTEPKVMRGLNRAVALLLLLSCLYLIQSH